MATKKGKEESPAKEVEDSEKEAPVDLKQIDLEKLVKEVEDIKNVIYTLSTLLSATSLPVGSTLTIQAMVLAGKTTVHVSELARMIGAHPSEVDHAAMALKMKQICSYVSGIVSIRNPTILDMANRVKTFMEVEAK